ncbi:MAG: glycosyltransferase family 2 protein [Halobacteriales archaeon]
MSRESTVLAVISFMIVGTFGVLYLLLPPGLFLLCALTGIGASLCSLVPVVSTRLRDRPTVIRLGFLSFLFVLIIPGAYAWLRADSAVSVIPVFSIVLLVALAFVFYYYSLFLPLALLSLRARSRGAASEINLDPDTSFPRLTIIVPAYNEESCIGASIDALKRTAYPDGRKEIIVVDDGSTDATYDVAMEHADETVAVLQKQNGGKHTALNYGLARATGEIVVTVDADSLLASASLLRIVASFQNAPEVGAVAGDLRVINRGRLLTELQELEYIIGIQLFRQALDRMATVVVIPGAFGAYRRSILEDVGRFDGDTLTEDRDATVKILKAGYETRAIDAICYTEAPETWMDLYNQRLRWYRGSVQTLLKHRDVFRRPDFGFLHSFAFPIELLSTVFVPIAGIVIVISIGLELLFGSVVRVVTLFSFFALLQVLIALLAVRASRNDLRLIVLGPLFVIGYRQFLDVVMLKSLFDVLSNRELSWTSPRRTGRLGEPTTRSEAEPDTD